MKKKYVWDQQIHEIDNEKLDEIDLQTKRYQILQREKEKRKEMLKKKKSRRKKKRFKYYLIYMFVFSLFIFLPIIPIKSVEIRNLNYLDTSQIKTIEDDKKFISIFSIIYLKYDNIANNYYISDVDINYSFSTKTLEMNIFEKKILGYDQNLILYIGDEDQIQTSVGLNVVAPILINFDQSNLNQILNQLNKLDYQIILEIESIKLTPTELSKELVTMEMKDGNTVEILISQISKKMPYYLQIQEVLSQNTDGEDGIIHLDVGDYYEPK